MGPDKKRYPATNVVTAAAAAPTYTGISLSLSLSLLIFERDKGRPGQAEQRGSIFSSFSHPTSLYSLLLVTATSTHWTATRPRSGRSLVSQPHRHHEECHHQRPKECELAFIYYNSAPFRARLVFSSLSLFI